MAESSPNSSTDDEGVESRKKLHNVIIHATDSDSDENMEKANIESPKMETNVKLHDQIPQKSVPNVNVPEKIILCVDCCQNENSKCFDFDSDTYTSLMMLKKITKFFLYSKQAINNGSEFALIVLKDNEPLWAHHFTKNVNEIISTLESFDSETCQSKEFDLSLLFDLIHDKVNLPEVGPDYKMVAPNNIVRLILMYNRSNCVPKFSSSTLIFEILKKHPYFTTDILYVHEEDCNNFICEEIYDALQTLDNGYSYIFEVARNGFKIHECGSKLLAHPLQRCLQKDASYVL